MVWSTQTYVWQIWGLFHLASLFVEDSLDISKGQIHETHFKSQEKEQAASWCRLRNYAALTQTAWGSLHTYSKCNYTYSSFMKAVWIFLTKCMTLTWMQCSVHCHCDDHLKWFFCQSCRKECCFLSYLPNTHSCLHSVCMFPHYGCIFSMYFTNKRAHMSMQACTETGQSYTHILSAQLGKELGQLEVFTGCPKYGSLVRNKLRTKCTNVLHAQLCCEPLARAAPSSTLVLPRLKANETPVLFELTNDPVSWCVILC